MNPSEDLRFEELVSNYLDAALSPEQEYELLQMIESPAYARAFMDLVRINSEITGIVSAPVADDKMAELVHREITRGPGRQSNVFHSIMDAIRREPAGKSSTTESVRSTPLITKPTFPWAIVISLGAHAALIALIIGMHFFIKVAPPSTVAEGYGPDNAEEAPKVENLSPVAKVEVLTGDAYSIDKLERTAASNGKDLAEGQALETGSANSVSDLRFADGTILVLHANTRVRQPVVARTISTQNGKRVYLERGTLNAQVSKQPEGQPMLLTTSNAEATVIGTRFLLTSETNSTRLEVVEGVVRLTRLFDHKSVMVQAGEFAVVTPGVELVSQSARKASRFVMGVNFYGGAVTIDGDRWMSQSEAQSKGLVLKYPPSTVDSHVMNVNPVPSVDAQTRSMLNSRAYGYGGDLTLSQPLPAGDYDVYLWLYEPAGNYMRSFDVEVNGILAEQHVGRMKLGEWKKAGPYRTHVDGKLEIRLKKSQSNPAISGMSIFSVDRGN